MSSQYGHMKSKKSIIELARELRKNPTPEEKILWEILRKRRFHGLKFLRQFPIIYKQEQYKYLFFIPDFYCSEKKLVIESDGGYHKKQKYYDDQRDIIINRLNINVLRIENNELQDLNNVRQKIRAFLNF